MSDDLLDLDVTTDRPLTVLLSHLHFDHSANFHRFSETALADLPILRACMRDNLFHAPEEMFLGSYEDLTWVPQAIRHWWPIGHQIDLGGRVLEIIATPGHSPESISLLDREHGILLAADFLYPGDLYGQIPGASLPDYLVTAERLIEELPADVLILGAHGKEASDGTFEAPKLFRQDLLDMTRALTAIRDRDMPPAGQNPDHYLINERMTLLVVPEAYGIWRGEEQGS